MTGSGKEITVDTIDLQPLLQTLSKISMNRIIAECEKTKEDEITQIKIPVKFNNPSDKKDTALRNFSKDWLRRKITKPIGIDARFEELPRGTSFYQEEGETPVIGCLVISFWPKKEESDFDRLKKQQKKNGYISAG